MDKARFVEVVVATLAEYLGAGLEPNGVTELHEIQYVRLKKSYNQTST
jgi:hypothetical protein